LNRQPHTSRRLRFYTSKY